MTEIKNLLLALIVLGIIHSVLSSVVLKEKKSFVSLVCGMITVLLVASCVLRIDFEQIGSDFMEEISSSTRMTELPGVDTQGLMAQIIKEQTESYILDKAAELGFEPTAEVTLAQDGEYPYPTDVTVKGCYTEAQKSEMVLILEKDLGIIRDRQEWIWISE